jgi:hypothetical protein
VAGSPLAQVSIDSGVLAGQKLRRSRSWTGNLIRENSLDASKLTDMMAAIRAIFKLIGGCIDIGRRCGHYYFLP